MSMYVHHVRGRFRVHVPLVRGSTNQARAFEELLAGMPGVTQVECRTITGSVIVRYDPSAADPAALLQLLGYEGELSELRRSSATSSPSSPDKWLATRAARTVLWFALEHAAERAIHLLLAVVF